jgi:dUTP pyrophosphatase
MNKVLIKVKKIRPGAQLPAYTTSGAAGADVRACFDSEHRTITLLPGETLLIPTGLAFEIESGYEVQVRPRSGLALKNGITVLNSPGTVDSDYRGEVGVILHNSSKEVFPVRHGDRIAQLVVAPALQGSFEVVGELNETQRDPEGFGSSGVK